ncbi:MAG: ATP-binding cassette domain-containing protein, partial [Bacillota bacterium]|nr:ATP-binding cassette domain-containing protein [Bacillota bacterium]
MSVFILDKISKTYVVNKKENKVLNNISLTLPDNGLFSIVGKSGCGKSTLLNILMGIEKPTSGKVYFEGT